MDSFRLTASELLLGLVSGSAYGLLAAGLILVYRSSKIINFAHGAMGAFVALIFGVAVVVWNIPYWLGWVLAMALAAGLGALCEASMVQRLSKAPRLIGVVATLGLAELLVALGVMVGARINFADRYPHPPGFPRLLVGSLVLSPSEVGLLFLTPLVVGAIAWFLRRSRTGLAIRAAASNPDRARLSGLSPSAMSAISWSIASCLSAFGAILLFPGRGFFGASSFGPVLLLRALVPVVLAKMQSMPAAVFWGLAVGVLEQALLGRQASGSQVEVTLFLLIAAAVLLFGRNTEPDRENWSALRPWPPLPERLAGVWAARNLGKICGSAGLGLAVLVPMIAPSNAAVVFSSIAAFALVGLSVGLVTGLSGQLTLGQFAFAGLGAAVSFHVVSRTGNFPLGALEGGLAAAAASLLIGLPALQRQGLMLAVTTLSFSLAAVWLFHQKWMLGSGVDIPEASLFGFSLLSPKSYFLVALAFLLLGMFLVRNVRAGGLGLCLVAARDNEPAARAFAVPAAFRRLEAFALGGFLAGLGGAVYAHGLSRIGSETFSANQSILVVAMTAIGGLGMLSGPLIGALYIIGVPAFVPLDSAGIAAGALGWLLLVLYFPGGLPQLLRPLREKLVGFISRRSGESPEEEEPPRAQRQFERVFKSHPNLAGDGPSGDGPVRREAVLRMESLSRSFGAVTAVEDFSAEIFRGEVVGLIGPNGAGKTTLLNLISGFLPAESGTIELDGRSIDGLPAHIRARRGLVRSFQNGLLFPTMTVVEVLRVAQERKDPASLLWSCLGTGDQAKKRRAGELLDLFGLGDYRNYQIDRLSTGTRRIVELACMVGTEPTVLLLDEPSAGIAQKETEALAGLLLAVRGHLQTTLLVVEHNMPLLMGVSDRMLAMEEGRLIASGDPSSVSMDPRVVESYLGGVPVSNQS